MEMPYTYTMEFHSSDFVQRVEDFGALSPKWDALIKLLPPWIRELQKKRIRSGKKFFKSRIYDFSIYLYITQNFTISGQPLMIMVFSSPSWHLNSE